MNVSIQPMNNELATTIVNWKYESPYDFYNNEPTTESMDELMDGTYYALLAKDKIVGFFCTGKSAQVPFGNTIGAYEEACLDMGLGMNPSLVGQGNGAAFCRFILQIIQEQFPNLPIRLTVATFNERAIHLYRKLGFTEDKHFHTNHAAFMTMVRR